MVKINFLPGQVFTILSSLVQVLPHVKNAGYNAIQLIGVVEHKDYFTVGYRVE